MPALAAVSPARRVAAAVLRRVEDEGAYADRALAGEARRARLDAREHAFATALTYGAVQRRRTLDHVIEALARRPVRRLDPHVRDALRLGVMQLLFLDGVAPHAAVDQSVELAKVGGGGGYRLVNAVLRRVGREGPRIVARLDVRTPRGAALLHSVPDWLAELWWAALGPEDARALLARANEPAETALRVNALRAEPAAVAAELAARGVATRAASLHVGAAPPGTTLAASETTGRPGEPLPLPEGLVVDGSFDIRSDPLFARGALVAQSRAAIAAARLLAPPRGARVLDLCAAPGGKATHLAALVGAGGEVVAVERHPGRAEALRRSCERLGAERIVRVETADAADPRPAGERYDAVIVDPPCSGLGTLQGRPDLRWRATPETIERLAELQLEILSAGAAALAPGGALLYVTCTISPRENAGVVDAFLADRPAFACTFRRQLLPHRDGTDGFFYARLERVG